MNTRFIHIQSYFVFVLGDFVFEKVYDVLGSLGKSWFILFVKMIKIVKGGISYLLYKAEIVCVHLSIWRPQQYLSCICTIETRFAPNKSYDVCSISEY